MNSVTEITRNYGVLTDMSSALNFALGDSTKRTVCVRTAHGLKETLNMNQIKDNEAEDLVHLGMAFIPILLNRKSDILRYIGIAIMLLLIVSYINGK